jgi:septum formation protein
MRTDDPGGTSDTGGRASSEKAGHADLAVILASGSPRRGLLLPIVCPVESVLSPDVDETPLPGESSESLARRLASAKLIAARRLLEERVGPTLVVAADTVVSLDEKPLGKPSDAADARAMLRALRGRSHTVITAVALWGTEVDQTCVTSVASEVEMRPLEDVEIERSIERSEPFDKAGGYAIQDPELRPVRSISGCFPNVVGLPLCAVQAMLGGTLSEPRFVPDRAPCDLCDRASDALNEHGFWADVEVRPA